MKPRMMSDLYQVSSRGQLEQSHIRILSLLYLPLMSAQSYALYLCLFAEVDRITCLSVESSHERLSRMSGLPLDHLDKSLRELEALGLIRTYISYKNDLNHYFYEMYLPLNAARFYTHPIFNTLLFQCLGEVEYEKTRYYFKTPKIDEDYEEITASFNDVFYVSLNERPVLKPKEDYRVNLLREVNIQYSLDVFYQHLKDYQIRRSWITPEIELLIKQLGTIYHLSELEMLSLVKDSLTKEGIDEDLLKKKTRAYFDLETNVSFKEVYYTQPKMYLSDAKDDRLKKHIEYLEKVSPYQLLKDRQGGKDPTAHDLAIVESLMTRLHLEPGVVNVLIEFVLSQNNERFTRSYSEAVAGAWARKKIKTVKEAMDEAMDYLRQRETHVKNEVEPEWFSQEKHENMFKKEIIKQEDEDFASLLSALKEGGSHV